MKFFLRTLLIFCALITAAHFLRLGNTWAAITIVTFSILAQKPGLIPRPILILAAGYALFLWMELTLNLVQIRLMMGLPWMRLAFILALVSGVHLSLGALLLGKTGAQLWGNFTAQHGVSSSVFILTFGILAFLSHQAPMPLLLGERFFPDSSLFWILGFAVYSSFMAQILLGPKSAQGRLALWTFFSLVFFIQLFLGLAGWEKLLMTGKLHLPLPALILAGPLFRGTGFFMLIFLLCTLIFVGPAWCSHLCYIGAWDNQCALLSSGKPQTLPAWTRTMRFLLLALTIIVPLALRGFGISWTKALGLAIIFALMSLAIMLIYSRRTGVMTHCTTWCPIGLMNNLLGRLIPWRIKINAQCTKCGLCSAACRYNALTPQDLDQNQAGLSCSLCADCLSRCPHGYLHLTFPGLSPTRARHVFVVLITSLHGIFLAIARI